MLYNSVTFMFFGNILNNIWYCLLFSMSRRSWFHKVYDKKQTYAYSVYQQFRNSLSRTIKIAKNSYYEKLINLNKNNLKKLSQTLGHLVNLK